MSPAGEAEGKSPIQLHEQPVCAAGLWIWGLWEATHLHLFNHFKQFGVLQERKECVSQCSRPGPRPTAQLPLQPRMGPEDWAWLWGMHEARNGVGGTSLGWTEVWGQPGVWGSLLRSFPSKVSPSPTPIPVVRP